MARLPNRGQPPSAASASQPAAPSAGGVVGLLLLATMLLLAVGVGVTFAQRAAAGQVSLLLFALGLLTGLLLLVAGLLGYWLAALRGLRYAADRNAITIQWGEVRQVIPIQAAAILTSNELEGQAVRRTGWRGVHWPGYYAGTATLHGLPLPLYPTPVTASGEVDLSTLALAASPANVTLALEGGATQATAAQVAVPSTNPPPALANPQPVLVYASRPLADWLYVCTPSQVYAISPSNPAQFAEEVRIRQSLGPTEEVAQAVYHSGLRGNPFWDDRVAQAVILLALAINIALFAYLCASFFDLPPNVELHWNTGGQPDVIGRRLDLFRLPLYGLVALVTDIAVGLWLARRERMVARFLYAGAAAVQIVFWAAVINIVL